MIVSAIAAIDRTGLIGNGMRMPWHLPRDLRRFRDHTMGKPVILGRRTFESLGSPLRGRLNIILTHSRSFRAEGCRIARSLEEALSIAQEYVKEIDGDEVMIAGGGVVFDATVTLWNRLLLTVIDGKFQGDTYFPLHRLNNDRWRMVAREYCVADPKNPHPHWFLAFERQGGAGSLSRGFDLASWLGNQSGPMPELPLAPC